MNSSLSLKSIMDRNFKGLLWLVIISSLAPFFSPFFSLYWHSAKEMEKSEKRVKGLDARRFGSYSKRREVWEVVQESRVRFWGLAILAKRVIRHERLFSLMIHQHHGSRLHPPDVHSTRFMARTSATLVVKGDDVEQWFDYKLAGCLIFFAPSLSFSVTLWCPKLEGNFSLQNEDKSCTRGFLIRSPQ